MNHLYRLSPDSQLLDPWPWTSSLQNCEHYVLIVSKPPSLSLVIATITVQNRKWYREVKCCYDKFLKRWKRLWNWGMGKAGRGLNYTAWGIWKGGTGESLEEEHCWESKLTDYLNCHEQDVGRVAKNLAKFCLCPRALWKAELLSVKIGYLAEEISKWRVEGASWCLSMACSKMWAEK
jgi:hypothetical protein